MARVASSIPNLFNGVSQQADTLRLQTQGEEQLNMYPSLVQGLVKRPPLQLVSSLGEDDKVAGVPGTFHVIDRGGDNAGRERSLLYVTPKGLTVYSTDGVKKSVSATPEALRYLSSCTDGRFDIVTIADYTFISNPHVRTRMASGSSGGSTTPTGVNAAVCQVVRAAYDTVYKIEIELAGDAFQYGSAVFQAVARTPSATGTTEKPPEQISTENIAKELALSLRTTLQNYAEWKNIPLPLNTYAEKSTIAFIPYGGYRIVRITATDSQGNALMKAVFDTVARFADLPSMAVAGMVVKVTGSDTTQANDYYVTFVPTSPSATELAQGVWKEHAAPGVTASIDASTMPHLLIDHGGSFSFEPCTRWGKRTVGDEITAPDPEFIGSPITGIFQYRNRLGLIAEDVVALSEASEFFNFFPKTVVTAVDSAPIFLTASLDGAPILRHAIPFNEEIILFADRSQFKLVAPEVLSPATAAINTLTKYPVNTDIKPLPNGKNIFFVDSTASFGDSTRVYEYFIDSDTGTKAAMDVTAHVPQYVDSGVTAMTCSTGLSLLCLYKFGGSGLWLYKYYWSGQEKLQSAWFQCDIGKSRRIHGAAFIGDVLYLLLTSNGSNVCLCKIDFSSTLLSATEMASQGNRSANFLPFLDMLSVVNLSGSYDPDTDISTVNIPDVYDAGQVSIIDIGLVRDYRPTAGPSGNKLTFRGNVLGWSVFIGERYSASYTFTRAFVREKSEGGQLTAHAGRLQLQKWRLVIGPTGYVAVEVRHKDGRTFFYPWTPPALNTTAGHRLGTAYVPVSDAINVPVRANASEVKVTIRNNSWLPSTIVSAEWEGNFTTKGLQRI